MNILFYTLIFNHIRYGIICYARTYKSYLNPLNILINRALRCINFYKRFDKKPSLLYYDQKILKLDDIFTLELGKFCFSFYNNLLPEAFNDIYTKTSFIHSHNTRNSNITFYLSNQNNKAGFNSLNYLGAKVWNSIPNDIKEVKRLECFKHKYKSYLLTNYQENN